MEDNWVTQYEYPGIKDTVVNTNMLTIVNLVMYFYLFQFDKFYIKYCYTKKIYLVRINMPSN